MTSLLTKLGAVVPGLLGKRSWDAAFRRGAWDHLFDLDELAHYMVIVGFIAHMKDKPRVLDVGCGSGRLFQLVSRMGYASYTGIDLSSEAIGKIDLRESPRATFQVADATTFQPPGRYDAIVFSEMLYYAKDPVGLLVRYGWHLANNGAIIVSMIRFPTLGRLWRKIDRVFSTEEATTVENLSGRRWQVRLLRPLRRDG